MAISLTAATFCCFASGGSSDSSSLFRFVVSTAATFHGAGGKAVRYTVWKEKQS